MLLAVGLLTVHAAVLDEAAGRAVLELDGVAPLLAAVSAAFDATILDRNALHYEIEEVDDCLQGGVEVMSFSLATTTLGPPRPAPVGDITSFDRAGCC